MNVFKKMFQKQKKDNIRKRDLSNISRGIDCGYLTYYINAINDYNNHVLPSALSNIKKAIELCDIDDWKIFAFMGNTLKDLNNYIEAIDAYKKAIGISETDYTIYALYHEIGYCYLMLKENNKAEIMFDAAINIKSNHPDPLEDHSSEGMDMGVYLGLPFKRMYINRANAFFNQNKLIESYNDCIKSIEYDPKYSNAYLLLSQILSKLGKESEAVNYLRTAANLGNSNAISLMRELGI